VLSGYDIDRYASMRDEALLRWQMLYPQHELHTPVAEIIYDLIPEILGFTIELVDHLPYDWFAYTDYLKGQILVLDDAAYQCKLDRFCQYDPDLEQHRVQTILHEGAGHAALPEHRRYAQMRKKLAELYGHGFPQSASNILVRKERQIESEAHIAAQVWAVPEWQLVTRPEYSLLKQWTAAKAPRSPHEIYFNVIKPLSGHFGVTPSNVRYLLARYGLITSRPDRVGELNIGLPESLPSWTDRVEAHPFPIPPGQERPSLRG